MMTVLSHSQEWPAKRDFNWCSGALSDFAGNLYAGSDILCKMN